jgi:hypothetical protein
MSISKVIRIAKQLDDKGFYHRADTLLDLLIKVAYEEDSAPVQLNLEGEQAGNDPKTVRDYFFNNAYYNINTKKKSQAEAYLELLRLMQKQNEIIKADNSEALPISTSSDFWKNLMADIESQEWWQNAPRISTYSPKDEEFEGKDDSIEGNLDPEMQPTGTYSTGFENAFKYIIGVEGSEYTSDPEAGDPPTKYGITAPEVQGRDVRDLTLEEAKEIYYDNYWKKMSGDKIFAVAPKTAIVVFDFFVNSGPGGAARNLRNVGINPGNPTNSEVAQKIIDLANTIGDGELANILISKRFLDYENIIQSNSKKAKFGPGWKNRLLRMQKFLGQ